MGCYCVSKGTPWDGNFQFCQFKKKLDEALSPTDLE